MIVPLIADLGCGSCMTLGNWGLFQAAPRNLQIAAKHGITPLAVVIRWTLHHGVSVIPRSGDAEHIRENCREIALAQQKGEADEQA